MASMATCFTLPPNARHLLVFKAALLPNRSQTSNFPGAASRVPQSRASAPVVRASIAAIRPGGAVESDKLPSDVRKRAMDAVDACGRRVTVGDVAGRAGLKLHEAQNALQALASDTQGFLEVSDEGDVLYVFPRDYRAKLVGRSFIMRVEPLLEKAKAGAEYLARVSFGTTLFASIILVFAAILVALIAIALNENVDVIPSTSSTSSFASGGSSYRTSYDYSIDVFPSCRTEVYRKQKEKPQPVVGTLKFGESFFSFVFGDGDPNRGIEEKRWKLIGNYISSNGGVVAAEELAPYLDIETTGDTLTDEAYILPVLSRYEGQPLIDEEGNILYQFPSLQRTASRKMGICPEIVGEADKFFKEEKWQFSKTSIAKRAMVVGLGGLNVFGVLILSGLLQDPIVAQVGFIKFITSINPLLQIYAGFFFVIPLFRWFVLLKTNADIEKRNQARKQFAQDIELPDLSLRRKLLSARNMAQRIVIGLDRIVYTSRKDLFEQELDRGFQQIDKS
ncbi:uncharacterized protein At5g03900, chloroplastic-like [Rosa rugosa]|uniref:uncharacterized protein At5g03900, chloroplastic-like n=1 Tax=Rosa rugosa TaxID=74645 RepID=UPI002B409F6C|nr:uncharacterized protein At5g03900, chloroplastic-like [Rosa rugosa]